VSNGRDSTPHPALDPADCRAVLDALLRRDLFGVVRTDDELAALERGAVSVIEKPYGSLLCRLLGYDPRLDEIEARAYWHEALAHRRELAEALRRPVHLRVAALDLVLTGRLSAQFGMPILVGPSVLGAAMASLTRDSATGLLTRAALLAALERALRAEGPRVLTLVVGLEGLDVLHDERGHAQSEALVARLGRSMSARLSGSTVVGRLAHAELGAVVVGDAANRAAGELGALRVELEALAAGAGIDIAVGSMWAAACDDAAMLVERADRAMAATRRARRAALGRGRQRGSEPSLSER
jgi:GGDEF domain-containing protein